MQKDTRRLTVAQEHLAAAYEEITQAQGQTERSISHAAVGRALNHLDLAWRRLEHERSRLGRSDTGDLVERAFAASRRAWQGVHDVLNDWPDNPASSLDGVRTNVLEALNAVTSACSTHDREALHR
jgi:hypothetical protein